MAETVSEQLPFDQRRQDAVLGYLMINDQFFKQCKDRLLPSWFLDPWAAKLYMGRINFYKIFDRCPTREELMSCDDFMIEDMKSRNLLNVKHVEACNMTKLYGLDTLTPKLTDWLHARTFQDAVHHAETLFNNGKTAEAYGLMTERMKYINTTSFVEEKVYDFSNFQRHVQRRELEVKNALSFGISGMDRLLLPLGEGKGSLLPGDTTLLMAPTNIGKTSTKLTIAAYNVKRCQPTILVTHEGVDDDIAEKMLMSMLECNKAQLYDYMRDPESKGYRDYMVAERYLSAYFTYIPMNKPGLHVEEVISALQRKQEERKAKWGSGYKLLIDDYPAKLGSLNTQYGQFKEKRSLDEYVYNHFVQFALEEKLHSLLSQQVNRTGAKINRGQKGYESRLLTPEDANESYGPAQIATNTITENRSPLDEQLGFITYYIGKCRSNIKGYAVVCASRYDQCITHSDKLGCTWYQGDLPLGDLVQSQFVAHLNKEIPRQALTNK